MCAENDWVLVPIEWFNSDFSQIDFKRMYKSTGWFIKDDIGCIKVQIDRCLADEIIWLNSIGVVTSFCCCGHGEKSKSYISVEGNESEQKMLEHGYVRRSEHFSDKNVFLPQSVQYAKALSANG